MLGLLAVAVSQFAWVRASNFAGFDEWLLLWLGARRIVDCPYAGRPLNFLWSLPGAILTPYGLEAYRLTHAAYFWLSGCWTLLLVKRLAPGDHALAFLAGAFAIAWAPLDMARLTSIQGATHAGVTCVTFLAMLLFVASWQERRPALLIGACLVALVAGRSYESPLPLLLFAPLLVRVREDGGAGGNGDARKLLVWSLPWLAVVLACGALYLRPLVAGGADVAYQSEVLKIDRDPFSIAARLVRQFGHHLIPLATVSGVRLDVLPVGLALVAWAAAFVAGARESTPAPPRALVRLAGTGLALAALGYSLFVLSPFFDGPHRTQMLSAPGIALLLAAALRLASLAARPRWRTLSAGVLGAWVLAAGTARTVAMQEAWDRTSYFPAQRGTLLQLTAIAPDLVPNTLVVLLDPTGAWPATFGFRHAVEHLYPQHATGIVWGAFDFLYPLRLTADGLRIDPWPSIQKAWGTPVTAHRFDELVVVRRDASGKLSLVEGWPGDALPALPPEGRYAPRARIVGGAVAPPERRVLERAR